MRGGKIILDGEGGGVREGRRGEGGSERGEKERGGKEFETEREGGGGGRRCGK